MSDEKTKVSDLPQDEQDALINEAKELNIRGLYQTWNVETLKAKIEQAKAAAANGEQTPAADEQEPANGEQEPAADEQNTENDEQEPAADEPAADEPAADEKPAKAPKVDKGNQRAYAKAKDAAPAVVRICHICRSKVVNGKCTGCGFELNA